jgi:hypothetical protein
VIVVLWVKKVTATASKLVKRGISLLGMGDSMNMATTPDVRI